MNLVWQRCLDSAIVEMMETEKGQKTLDEVQAKISVLYPEAKLVRTPMSLQLEPINQTAASLELMIETGDFFTVVVNGHSLELTLEPERCVEIFEAILTGSCRQEVRRKGRRVVKVVTEIVLESETIRYERSELFTSWGRTESEAIQFQAYSSS